MLRILIIDDEALARQHLRQLLAEHSDVEVAGEAASVAEALKLIEEEKPDALFLDVRMPGANGMTLAQGLVDPPKIVFVTAHAEHAVEAFDAQAVDFLLKPVRPSRLATALERVRSKEPGGTAWQMKDKVCFKTPQRTIIVEPRLIIALEADGDFTQVLIKGEVPIMICHNLSYYEKILPSPPFLRLDRSLMINLDRVNKIEPEGKDHERLILAGVQKSFSLGRAEHRRLAEAIRE